MSTKLKAGTATSGAVIDADTTGILELQSGSTPTTAITVDTAQNVGIGTASPTAKIHASTASASAAVLILNSSNNTPYLRFDQSDASKFIIGESSIVGGGGTGYYDLYATSGLGQRFYTNASERMRIDSSGRVLFNLTTAFTGFGDTFSWYSAGGLQLSRSANGDQIGFYINGTFCGKISSSGSTTTYATSSDYRLKQDIAPMTGALATVSALKPVTYKWKSDGTSSQGFIAHELQELVPECVVGEKDAVDEDGKPQYQSIDTSFLVATLTAAIQELNATVTAQTAQIAALTAKVGA